MPANTPDRTPSATKTTYRFGEFELRPGSGELFRNAVRVRVQEQSLQVLLALLENPGEVVSREQLRERLWPEGTYVDFEHSLNAAVKRLRAALDDDADNPRYIETLPRRGYRLMVEVASESPAPPTEPQAEPAVESPSRRRLLWGAAAVVLLLLAVAAIPFLRSHSSSGSHPNFSVGTLTPQQNGEAYELYLRSIAYKLEFPANGQAIQLLERSTQLDPGSARSWYELARRYRIEFINTGRGRGFLEQAREANRRALELAPDFSPAKLHQVTLDLESGQVGPAYEAALAMTRANPRDANAHYALSYALRHGGMFEESAAECDRALKLDPSNATLRSCGLVFILLGRYDRATPYLDLDPLSSYVRFRRMELAILANDKTTALEVARSIRVGPHDYPDARMMEAALSGAPAEAVRNWSRETEALLDSINFPESNFVEARYQAWAGQTDAALRLLRRAIANNYCSYPVTDTDPLLANVRRLPEYKDLRQAGVACRENFRSQVQKAH